MAQPGRRARARGRDHRRRRAAQGQAQARRAHEPAAGLRPAAAAVRLHPHHLLHADPGDAVPERRRTRSSRPTSRARSRRSTSWDPAAGELPPEAAFAALAEELAAAYESRELGRVATRLNYEASGTRSLLTKTGRNVADIAGPEVDGSWRATLLDIDEDWGDPERLGGDQATTARPTRSAIYLAALDLRYDARRRDRRPARAATRSTSRCSCARSGSARWSRCSACCSAIPVAYLLATLPTAHQQPADDPRAAAVLDLAPGAHHRLDRAAADRGRAQRRADLPRTSSTSALQLIFNRFGVIVAMTHILLPFMILPIYS